MTLFPDKLRKFPGLQLNVLIFVLTAVIGITGAFLLIAYKQGLLQERARILLLTPDGSGISIGMPVRLLGFRVGKVQEMRLKYPTIEIELAINQEHLSYIPRGSKARIAREGVIGASYIEILPTQQKDAVPIAADDSLEFARGMSLSELPEYFEGQVLPVVSGLRDTLFWLNNPEGDFRRSFTTLLRVAEGLEQTQRSLDLLLEDLTVTSGTMRNSVAQASGDVSSMARNIERTVTTEIPQLRASMEATLAETNKTLREFRQLGKKTDQTVGSVQPVVRDAGEITDAIKHSWPVNRMLDDSKTRLVPGNISELPLPSRAPKDKVNQSRGVAK